MLDAFRPAEAGTRALDLHGLFPCSGLVGPPVGRMRSGCLVNVSPDTRRGRLGTRSSVRRPAPNVSDTGGESILLH